jgi:phosphatidate cytidylyltransferase
MKNGNVLFKRISSAVILLPLYLFLMWFSGFEYITIFVLSAVISIGCLYEYYQICSSTDQGKPFIGAGMIAAFMVNLIVFIYAFGRVSGAQKYVADFDARWLIFILVIFFAAIMISQIFVRPIKGGIFALSITVFGVMYIALFFSHIILIRSLANGFLYLLILHVAVMVNDSFAYFGGMMLGKHKTGLAVSPNKSWEGYFSGILFSIVFVLIANEFFATFYGVRLFGMVEAALMGVIFSIAGDLGDLIESAVKRDGKVKDSGTLIPGHGGLWDVFDALIFTMPIYYYFLKIKGVQ